MDARRDNSEKFSLVDGLSVPAFAIDTQHRVVAWNRACESLTGVPAAQVFGTRDHWRGFYPAPRPCLADLVLDDLISEASNYYARHGNAQFDTHAHRAEGWFDLVGGDRRYLVFEARPAFQAGELVGAIEILTDSTELKSGEERLLGNLAEREALFDLLRASEARLRETLVALGEGVYGVDCDGCCTFINPAALEILQYSEVEILGRQQHLVFHHSHPDGNPYPSEECPILRTVRDGQARRQRDWFIRKDGSFVPVELVTSPNFREGTLVGAVVAFQDISGRLEAEGLLRKLSLAVEQNPESIVITDLDFRIEYVNEAFVASTGYSREEAVGETPRISQSGKTPSATYLAMRQSLAAGKAWSGHFHNRRKDGTEYTSSALIMPLRQVDGKITHYLSAQTDVTEKIRLEAELDRYREHLEELVTQRTRELADAKAAAEAATTAKSAFLANMSHEIRTPMNAIIGMADLALATDLTNRQRNYLDKIKIASDALLAIINDILDFSKIEAGRLTLEAIPFALESVIEQLSSVVALRAEKQGVELAYDIGDDTRLLVGDPLRLGQVLINLVGNAVKFSTGGDVVIKVEVRDGGPDWAVLHFSVADEGIGMTAEQLAGLFQPFVQADASTTRRYGGTGLGLAISRQLVEMMGGQIWAESAPGVGSTFHFTAHFQVAGPDRRGGTAEFAERLSEHAERPVLIVDDNRVALQVLTRMTAQLGLKVDAAGSGAEALGRVNGVPLPDYVACLVDWRMPQMDGLETVRRLREAYRTQGRRAPPCLMVTAYGHDDELQDLGGHVDGLLVKPVNARNLYVELARCLGVFDERKPELDRRKAGPQLQWARFRGLDILLVEDIEINQEVIRELLANVGLTVRIAANGAEAIEAVGRQCPDLILMDCHMPVMDGYEATRRLRADPRWHALPIIALTANATTADQEMCFAAGMNAHVAKPIRMQRLYEKMDQCLPGLGSDAFDPVGGNRQGAMEPTGLPNFPGIDVAIGLTHVGGRLALYLRLLKQFRDGHCRNFSRQFGEARDAGDWEVQVRLAHTLKGVADTLGAVELKEAAVALLAAAQAKDAKVCAACLLGVLAQLEIVAVGLARLEPD